MLAVLLVLELAVSFLHWDRFSSVHLDCFSPSSPMAALSDTSGINFDASSEKTFLMI